MPRRLTCGDDVCCVAPYLGGSITQWTVQGQAMLRTMPPNRSALGDPYQAASFPLVPYSNRIANARFQWNDKFMELARNFLPEPHAIHGVGLAMPWQVEAQDDSSILLSFLHEPGAGWPWAFHARQKITLSEGRLDVALRVENLESDPVPLAFGHHPYLPSENAYLQFASRAVWSQGDNGLPETLIKPEGIFDFSRMAPVARADIDHCFAGWGRTAKVSWPGKPWALEIHASEGLDNAVVCIRRDENVFCFEPVPHMINAINMIAPDSAMPVVAPHKYFDASIQFRAVRP
jgi:aldose 1-epimerase